MERGQTGEDLGLFSQNLARSKEAAGTRLSLPVCVVRQAGQQAVQMVSRQEGSLRLELKPPSLDEANLELAVKDSVVKATVVTEAAAAKQMLENGLN